MAGACGDELRRPVRAAEIAAVKPRKRPARQPPGQRARLRLARRSERAVQVPLVTALDIPDRFPVPQKDDARARHARNSIAAPSRLTSTFAATRRRTD